MRGVIAIVCPDEAVAGRAPARLAEAVEKGLVDVADVVSSPATTTAGFFLFWGGWEVGLAAAGWRHGGRVERARFGRYLRCAPGVEVT
jgi:hypothetical protein